MRIAISRHFNIAARKLARMRLGDCAKACGGALAAAFIPLVVAVVSVFVLVGFQPLAAQNSAPRSASTEKATPAHKPVHRHSAAKPSPAHPLTTQPEATYTPLAPPAPIWPANDQPVEASIVWDSKGLFIDAKNSSLEQILDDVSTATGAKVEGLDTDERVFGIYGPGEAKDVLSALLHGSNYNVMMVGDQGQGTPREILLSVRHPADPHQATAPRQNSVQAQVDDEPEQEEPQPAPPPNRNVFTPGGPGMGPGSSPRTPQQIMEEMQQRQREQSQQPPNPQN